MKFWAGRKDVEKSVHGSAVTVHVGLLDLDALKFPTDEEREVVGDQAVLEGEGGDLLCVAKQASHGSEIGHVGFLIVGVVGDEVECNVAGNGFARVAEGGGGIREGRVDRL